MTGYAHPEVLVDTNWLESHLLDPQLRLLEVDTTPNACSGQHLPGAIFWSILKDLSHPDMRMKLESSSVADLLSHSGITPQTTVVAYGSNIGVSAVIFWFLKLFGHDNVFVLNGGHQKWVAEGRPTTDSLDKASPTSYPVGTPNPALRTTYTVVRASLGEPQQVLLDVRTQQEYDGEHFLFKPPEGSERAGHIPGAIHLDYVQMLNKNGTFKSAETLRLLFDQHGITPDKTIIPYCAIGGRSAFAWFVLTYLLGYPNVQNYDGSWNEWSRLPDAPIA